MRAGSLRSRSSDRVASEPRTVSISPHDFDRRELKVEHLEPPPDTDEPQVREAWLAQLLREDKRRKRRSTGTVQKRTHAQSVGSERDDEDMVAGGSGGGLKVGEDAEDGETAPTEITQPPADNSKHTVNDAGENLSGPKDDHEGEGLQIPPEMEAPQRSELGNQQNH